MFLIELSTEQKAQMCRTVADSISVNRNRAAKIVVADIVSGNALLPRVFRYGSIGGACLVASLGVADAVDGRVARYGARRYGLPITKHDNEMDPLLDKEFNKMFMIGFSVRAAQDGLVGYSGSLLAIQSAVDDRDRRMDVSRKSAVDDKNTAAIKLSKYKTGTQNLMHSVAMSPVALNPVGRVGIVAGYTASAGLGEISLRQADAKHRGDEIPSWSAVVQSLLNDVELIDVIDWAKNSAKIF